MKKLLTFIALALSLSTQAQNVKQDSNGNYIAIKQHKEAQQPVPTGHTYTDSKGITYPVYSTTAGKLFIIRTSKAGNQYKQYLKL